MPTTSPETRRLRIYVVAAPWLMVALVAAPMAVKGWLDARAEPYVTAHHFNALPDCPSKVVTGQALARRCVDSRYRIRQGADRYGLRRDFSKRSDGWLRIGDDAARLRDCHGETCTVVEVVEGVFGDRAAVSAARSAPR